VKRPLLVLLLVFCLLLCGCDSWLDGSYASVTPHTAQQSHINQGLVMVSTTQESISFLVDMIENGLEYAVFALDPIYAETIMEEMDTSIRYVTGNTPIAAFTVAKISYEVGSTAGVQAVGVTVVYNTNQLEIKTMREAEDSESALMWITEALTQCKDRIVIQVEDYSYMDFDKKIREFVTQRPDAVMETPQVTIRFYPDSGAVRVLDVRFSYQNQLESLRSMQNYVQPVFAAAELNVRGEDGEHAKITRLYAFLMERNDYRIGTSNTPAYSLLRHGVGDSMAFARVYAAMCSRAKLECYVVSGTRNGEPWSWNIIRDGDSYYHIDLLRADTLGGFHCWRDQEMQGYIWDYSSYPACVDP
jgi:hypothetical protein